MSEQQKMVPVAWMRDDGLEGSVSTMTECCSDRVKQIWLNANPTQVERYTIPLYAAPVAPPAPAGEYVHTARDDFEHFLSYSSLWGEPPDVQDKMFRAFAAAWEPAPSPAPAADAPQCRGYAHLGIGAYLINHSRAGEIPELCISLATEEERAGRVVGDERDNEPDSEVRAEDMVVRLRFENAAGLDALEAQLRHVRRVHFPDALAAPAATGIGPYCHPADAGKPGARRWMLIFEDADRGTSVYYDEPAAREAFAKSEAMGWNCHLFVSAERSPPAPAADELDRAVDKAWTRFCGAMGDGPDAPYPGMISAFETYYGQSFRDKDWRNETSVWAAAWKASTAKSADTFAAQAQENARLRKCVEDCCTRMERARGILSDEGNWAMLDTKSARAELKEPSRG